MRKVALMLATAGLALLLACEVAFAQEADTTPPDTTIGQNPAEFSNSASPTFAFSSDDSGATFECQLDGGAFETCSSPKQYFFPSEGQHTFAVRARDSAGNADPTAASYSWTADSLNPEIIFTEEPSESTNDKTPTWSWTIEDANLNPSRIQCILFDWGPNVREIYRTPCASTFTFGADLPDSFYQLRVIAYDKAFNVEEVFGYARVDTSAPAAPDITAPSEGSFDNDGDVRISGKAEAGSTVKVTDGTATKRVQTGGGRSWSVIFRDEPEGPHTYTAEATDAASNTSPSSNSRTIKVDTAGPHGNASINDGRTSTSTRRVTLQLSATDPRPSSRVANMRLRNDGTTTWSNWLAYSTTMPWALNSGAGKKTVYVKYRDGAGNVSAAASDTITYRP